MESEKSTPSQVLQVEQTGKQVEHIQAQADILFETAYNLASKISETGLGQFAIKQIDNFLWTVEKTAKWSISIRSKSKSGENVDSVPTVVRPLPWIPFLAAIITLRVVRTSLSVVSVMIGNESIKPSNIVHFIQSRRRKLRTIKYHGLRAMRLKKQDPTDRKRRGVLGIISVMYQKFCFPIGSRFRKDSSSKLKQLEIITKPESSLDDGHYTNELLVKYTEISSSDDSDYSDDENIKELSSEDSETEDTINDESKEIEVDPKLKQGKEQNNSMHENITEPRPEDIKENDFHFELKTDDRNDSAREVQEHITTISVTSLLKNPEKIAPKIAHNGRVENKNIPDPMNSDSSATNKFRTEGHKSEYVTLKWLSSGSSSEDIFQSPIGSPECNKSIENFKMERKNQYNKKPVSNENEKTSESIHKQPHKAQHTYHNNSGINARKAN